MTVSARSRGAVDIPSFMAASVTYSATTAATVVWEIGQPATPTRLIKVHRVLFSAVQTAAGNIGDWRLEIGSTSTTGGTSASMTAVQMDSGQPIAASSLVKNYTGNPNVGTLTGIIWQPRMLVPAAATAINPSYVFDFDTRDLLVGNGITLRKSGESLRLNMGGGTIPTGLASCQVSVYWTEEKI